MKNTKMKFLFPLLISLSASCTKICVTDEVYSNKAGASVKIGRSDIPCDKQQDFEKAALYTIEAIHSKEFEYELAKFMEKELVDGGHVKAWKEVDVKDIVTKMKKGINGNYATTYGGVKGLWLYAVFGNIAYDGVNSEGETTPIRFNRWPLKRRTVAQISNTLAHEIAHRVGYKHPSSDDSLAVANKEPAYVIGNIVEEIVLKFEKDGLHR